MDPISTMTRMAGESAHLITPAATAPFDPAKPDDYRPNTPGRKAVRGFPDRKETQLPDGAVAVFTMPAAAWPDGLEPEQTRLEWRDQTWRVMSHRPRYWKGRLNGFTLYLAK